MTGKEIAELLYQGTDNDDFYNLFVPNLIAMLEEGESND